tara:strand:+ start:74 stop:637 length:564 start_codon:yes stop_codon:yes gene_type:complete
MNSIIKDKILTIIEYDLCYDFNKNHKDFNRELEEALIIMNDKITDKFINDNNERFNLKDIVEEFFDEDGEDFENTINHSDDIYENFYEPQITENWEALIGHIKTKKLEAFDLLLNHINYDCYTIIKKMFIDNLEEEELDYFGLDIDRFYENQMDQYSAQKEDEEFDWTEMNFDPNSLMESQFTISHY